MTARKTRRRTPKVDGVVWMSAVKEERLAWVWRGYIPYGKVTVLDGDPSLGKSTIAYDLVARLSRGTELPDRRPLGDEPSICLVASGEDDLADTIKPRLRAAGANMRLVATLALRRDDEGNVIPFTVPDDVPRLAQVLGATRATFVVVDPIMAFFSESINAHNDASVRKALSQLTTLAQTSRAAFLLLRHLTKEASNTKAMYRGGGSIAITAAARSVLLAAPKPGDKATKVLAQTKGNLVRAEHAPSLEYRIEPWRRDAGIPVIRWMGESELTADELLRQHDGRRNDYQLREAMDFWRTVLARRPQPMKRVHQQAKDAGVSPTTLKRASGRLGIHKYPRRTQAGRTRGWWAHLPDQPCPTDCCQGQRADNS